MYHDQYLFFLQLSFNFLTTVHQICYKTNLNSLIKVRFNLQYEFKDDLKFSIEPEVIELFKKIIFGPYLNIPSCNYHGQSISCYLRSSITTLTSFIFVMRKGIYWTLLSKNLSLILDRNAQSMLIILDILNSLWAGCLKGTF